MLRKALLVGLLMGLCLCIWGCGMSEEEQKKDLKNNLYAVETLVDFGLTIPYQKYCNNYQSVELYLTEQQVIEKRLEGAKTALGMLQKFQKSLADDKFKLKRGNSIDKDNDLEKLKKEFVGLAKELEEMTQFKILILEKMKNGETKATKEEINKLNNLEKKDKEFDDKMDKVHNYFSAIIKKHSISGLSHM